MDRLIAGSVVAASAGGWSDLRRSVIMQSGTGNRSASRRVSRNGLRLAVPDFRSPDGHAGIAKLPR
jgi:hypothetical protein